MKIKYLLISGVRIDSVPVLNNFVNWANGRSELICVVEHKGKNGIVFVLKSILLAIKHRHSSIIFANTQAAFPLRLIQLLPIKFKKIYYWAIESTSNAPMWSPVWLGIWSEKLLRYRDVNLIIPIEERRGFFNEHYRSCCVIENVPLSGLNFIKRDINHDGRISLVIYGNLSTTLTYSLEMLELVKKWPNLFCLTLIGNINGIDNCDYESENITFLNRVPHSELLDILKQKFHFSIVGYKSNQPNYRNCAPNKLYESFSLSLPVIGSINNPTISRVLSEYDAGVLVDFNNLDGLSLYTVLINDYARKCSIAYSAYTSRYNFDYVISRSSLDIMDERYTNVD